MKVEPMQLRVCMCGLILNNQCRRNNYPQMNWQWSNGRRGNDDECIAVVGRLINS